MPGLIDDFISKEEATIGRKSRVIMGFHINYFKNTLYSSQKSIVNKGLL